MTIATTDFLARGGDAYPFPGQGLTAVQLGTPIAYQQALLRYLTEPTTDGGLGGTSAAPTVTPAAHPVDGVDRQTLQNPPTALSAACP